VAGRDVRVVYTKYDGSLHWHYTMRRLGTDQYGVWLGAAASTPIQRGSEPPIVLGRPWIHLIPDGQWWTAAFNGEPADAEIYCDIATEPRWLDPDEVTMVDLDLDVVRMRRDGRVLLLDEDEFAEHQVRYGYPAEVISRAEQSAAWLLATVRAGVEPFGTAYRPWLDAVIADSDGVVAADDEPAAG
jgi:uncharacterized protein